MTVAPTHSRLPLGAHRAASAGRRLGFLIKPAGWLLAALAFFALCLRISFTAAPTSDAAAPALAGSALWHGHLLLHGWDMADISFYTSDIPLYGLVQQFVGLNSTMLHTEVALVYTLVALTAAWLAATGHSGSAAWRRAALTGVAMAAPLFGAILAPTFLELPLHFGTGCYAFVAYILYAARTQKRSTPLLILLLLVLGQLGDATVLYMGATSIGAAAVLRMLALRKLTGPHLWVASAAALSFPVARALRLAMRAAGSYAMTAPKAHIASPSAWPANAKGTLASLLSLYNVLAPFQQHPVTTTMVFAAIVGAAVVAAGCYGFFRTLLRWPRADLADQLACLSLLALLGSFTVSTMGSASGGYGYEFPDALPLLAVLAARNLPAIRVVREGTQAVIAGGVALVILVSGAVRPSIVSTHEQLASWLSAHGLNHGISGYFDASTVTVDSGDAVQVRAVFKPGSGYQVYPWWTDTAWYRPSSADANFFIANPALPGLTPADVESVYGKPIRTDQVANRVIMVYPFNLLTKVYPALKPPA